MNSDTRFALGAVLNDSRLAIEMEGFQCPLKEDGEDASPHPLWCVTGLSENYVQLAAASWKPVKDDGFLVLDPRRAITDAGQYVYVLMQFTITRHRNEVVVPGHFDNSCCQIMPGSWRELSKYIKGWCSPKQNEELSLVEWEALNIAKCMLDARWEDGCKGKSPVTLRQCLEDVDRTDPPVYADWEEMRGKLKDHFTNLIGMYGPDREATNLLLQ